MEWEWRRWGDIWWSERTALDGAEANEDLPHSGLHDDTSLQTERERRRKGRVRRRRRRRVNHGASILETQQIYERKPHRHPPTSSTITKRRSQGKANKTRQRAGGKTVPFFQLRRGNRTFYWFVRVCWAPVKKKRKKRNASIHQILLLNLSEKRFRFVLPPHPRHLSRFRMHEGL